MVNDQIKIKYLDSSNKRKNKKIIRDITKIHQNSFKGFFLSFLGPRFLYRLYSCIADYGDGILIVAEESDQVVGFVAGVTDQKSFYNYLIRKHKWSFAISAIPAVLKKPSIIPRLIRALKKPREAEDYSSGVLLMSIGVDPKFQGRKIGEILINEFCRELIKRGCKDFCLTTDRDNNEKANNFYKKTGFKLIRTFKTPEGRAMNEYLKILEEQDK
ncbi:MAG: GNAT family N-acetyltransferase [Candidatus Aminicenantes bacterium]|nr:GNAT family N-acetyltransferase [Candidatus Aminicenantes bacterium]